MELLMDRAIGDAAKRAISRQLADVEQKPADLAVAFDGLRDDANDNTGGLATIIRETFAAARENLRATATPAEFNRFIEQHIGAMVAGVDGSMAQKKLPAASATGSVPEPRRPRRACKGI